MADKRFSMHVDPRGDVLAAARQCEADVFLEAYGNTAAQWREEYERYDPASVFVAIVDAGADAVGCMRIILPNPVGLKSLVDVQKPPWDVDADRSATAAGMLAAQTCDVATVAVRRQASNGGVLAAALYHGLSSVVLSNRLRWLVMIMDARARRLLSMLSLETHVLPGTSAAPYLGSTSSVPLFADGPRMLEIQRRRNPDAGGLVEHGVGLDMIALPEAADFVLAPRRLGVAHFVPRSDEFRPHPEQTEWSRVRTLRRPLSA